MKTRFFALAMLALALVACNNDNENLNGDPVAAQFTADIAPATRASGTTWTGGDRIGITDIGNDSQYGNVPFILKTGNLRQKERLSISKIQRPILSAPTIRTTWREASSQPDRCHGAAEPACHRLPLCFRSHGRQKQPGSKLHRQNRQRR